MGMLRRIPIAIAALALLGLSAPASPAAAADYYVISSPSDNIYCDMGDSSFYRGVRCDVRVHTWPRPPRPSGCDLDWGDSLYVGTRGVARWTCHGDTLLGSDSYVLPYGRSLRVGRFKCTSKTTGMRCVNLRTGHGFLISKSKRTRF